MSTNDSSSSIMALSSSSKKKTSIPTETTATMLTMDHHCQDADDLLLMQRGGGQQQQQQQQPMGVEDSPDEQGKHKPASWWKRSLDTLRQVASNDDGEPNTTEARMTGSANEGTHYKPLQEDNNDKMFHPRYGGNKNARPRSSPREESLLAGGATAEPLSSRSVIDVISTSGVAVMRGSTTAQEDALQEDCSFFYKAHDEEIDDNTYSNRQPRGRFRALRYEEHQHAFSYQDAVDVLTPSFLQAYKSRYEQLNQVDPYTNPLYVVSPDQHDLVLSEGSEENSLVQIQRIVKSETTVNSSIFYEHDGRVLMRLPIDAVRLVMDPDLEAGVLSVEQWRHEKQPRDEETGWGHLPQQQQQDNQPLEELPPLRYVLTVSPDLYRKIVSEMSDSLINPFCGFSKCCSDNGKADIRIAILILLFVFFVLFINTEAMGPHS